MPDKPDHTVTGSELWDDPGFRQRVAALLQRIANTDSTPDRVDPATHAARIDGLRFDAHAALTKLGNPEPDPSEYRVTTNRAPMLWFTSGQGELHTLASGDPHIPLVRPQALHYTALALLRSMLTDSVKRFRHPIPDDRPAPVDIWPGVRR